VNFFIFVFFLADRIRGVSTQKKNEYCSQTLENPSLPSTVPAAEFLNNPTVYRLAFIELPRMIPADSVLSLAPHNLIHLFISMKETTLGSTPILLRLHHIPVDFIMVSTRFLLYSVGAEFHGWA
jgi:hypothetical protein